MALYYRIHDIRGSHRVMSLAKAKAIVSRELKISPLYISLDAEGEYLRVDFAKPRLRKGTRPARRRKAKQTNSVKIIGIEFRPR